jgi:hypothetical protein
MKRHLLWISLLLIPGVLVFLQRTRGYVEWDGATRRKISVQVINNETGETVSGATVALRITRDNWIEKTMTPDLLREALREQGRIATTSADGLAIVYGFFGAGGTRGFFRDTGGFRVDAMLTITHPEFAPSEGMLQSYLGRNEFPLSTRELHATVFVVRPIEPR